MFWDSEFDQLQRARPCSYSGTDILPGLVPAAHATATAMCHRLSQSQSRHNSHAVSLRHGLHALLGTNNLLGLVMRALLIVSCQGLVKLCVLSVHFYHMVLQCLNSNAVQLESAGALTLMAY